MEVYGTQSSAQKAGYRVSVVEVTEEFPRCTNQNKITLHAAPYKSKQNLPSRASPAAPGNPDQALEMVDLQQNTFLSQALFFSSFEYDPL